MTHWYSHYSMTNSMIIQLLILFNDYSGYSQWFIDWFVDWFIYLFIPFIPLLTIPICCWFWLFIVVDSICCCCYSTIDWLFPWYCVIPIIQLFSVCVDDMIIDSMIQLIDDSMIIQLFIIDDDYWLLCELLLIIQYSIPLTRPEYSIQWLLCVCVQFPIPMTRSMID